MLFIDVVLTLVGISVVLSTAALSWVAVSLHRLVFTLRNQPSTKGNQ